MPQRPVSGRSPGIDDTLAFMFETRYLLRPTRFAMHSPELQSNYADCWQGLTKRFSG